jgi:hypothetical protein
VKVSTDDLARNLRYPWMGPASAPFGFEVRFPVVGIFVSLCVAGWLVAWLVAPSFRIGALLFVLVPAGSFWVTRKAAPHLTPDTPLRYYWSVIQQEWRTPRPPR